MKINNATPNLNCYMQNQNNNTKNVAFSGATEGVKAGAKKLFVLGRNGALSRHLFLTNAFMFLLGGRLITSRDKNEVRETATRDVPTILIAVMGVPFFGKLIAKQLQKSSGFAITKNEKRVNMFKWQDWFMDPKKPKMDIASGNQLEDWYKYDDKLALGFDGFSKRLKEQGGNLKKIYSRLSDGIKKQLSGFDGDNDKFMTKLSEVEHTKLKQEIVEAFKNGGNKALEHARFLKTVPTIFGFAATLTAVGIGIPKLNIFLTEHITKKKVLAGNIDIGEKEPSKKVEDKSKAAA